MRSIAGVSTTVGRGMLTREFLVGLKTRALRRRVWFKVLNRIERGLVDLTIRWVERVRSGKLATVLMVILEKLAQAMESRVVSATVRGRVLAARLSEMAVGWGDSAAFEWRFDLGFQRSLGLGTVLG